MSPHRQLIFECIKAQDKIKTKFDILDRQPVSLDAKLILIPYLTAFHLINEANPTIKYAQA